MESRDFEFICNYKQYKIKIIFINLLSIIFYSFINCSCINLKVFYKQSFNIILTDSNIETIIIK